MRSNVPINELQPDEEAWIVAVVWSVREGSTKAGRAYTDALAVNATGRIPIRVWAEDYDDSARLKPGIWKLAGALKTGGPQPSFGVSKYKEVTLGDYQGFQRSAAKLPRAFTLDIETIPDAAYLERASSLLMRQQQLGRLKPDQEARYSADPDAEARRAFELGALAAHSGRILCIAVHVGPQPEFAHYGAPQREHVFGIGADGTEQPEATALKDFMTLMGSFDREVDEVVGHNIIGFDIPYLFQRCIVTEVNAVPFVNMAEFQPRGVFDTMRRWWLGDRRTVSLDDLAWAMRIESSKTEEVDGSKVFSLYEQGRLDLIREYNLNDVRLTRRVYERIVRSLGR